MYLQDVFIL